MGPIAGRKLMSIIENTKHVLAIEIMSACQALDLRRPLKTSASLENVFAKVRRVSAYVERDRTLHNDIVAIAELIDSGELLSLQAKG
jgi:histidine ammonia-lyase